MRKFFLLVLILWTTLSSSAIDFVKDTVLSPGPVEMSYHMRVLPASRGKSSATLKWNVSHNGDCNFARLNYDPAAGGEDWDEMILLEIGTIEEGKESVQKHGLRLDGDPVRLGCSIKLSLTAGGASVAAAVRRPAEWFPVPYELADTVALEASASGIKAVLRYDLQSRCPEQPRLAPFDSLESLLEYLSASDDPYEGVWVHYDSDTDPRLIAIGGRYTLATVSRGDGEYDIIYIDGDPSWTQMRIKGSMKAATFPGIFDLDWLQPSGVPVGDGCGAQILDDLLSFSFPYWKATLRMRRLKNDK